MRQRHQRIDLPAFDFAPTFTQRTLDTRATAWLYDALRDRATGAIGMPGFADETRSVARRLALAPGDIVLDVIASAAFRRVNCSGGLHQMPDLGRALAEMARVTQPGGRFAASTFARAGERPCAWRALLARRLALHFVPERRLAEAIAGAGYSAVEMEMAGPFFAYAGAVR